MAALKEAYRDARSEADAAAGELAALRVAHIDLQHSKDHSAEQVGCLPLFSSLNSSALGLVETGCRGVKRYWTVLNAEEPSCSSK